MAEPIKVAVRVRPFSKREFECNGQSSMQPVVSLEGATATIFYDPPKSFQFDYGYWSVDSTVSAANQQAVYNDIGSPIVENALDGYNGTLFCYGQTGSGKSHTMMGHPDREDQKGMIPRAMAEIFSKKAQFEGDAFGETRELRIWISFIEIYNEHIRDLLVATDQNPNLKIVDHPKVGVYIPQVTEAVCHNLEDSNKLVAFGMKRRVTAATYMNATSSRSHAVFMVKVQYLEGEEPRPREPDVRKVLNAKINFTDLAGSERQAKSGAEGLRLREGGSINQSLSTLALVIKELSENAAKKSCSKIKAGFRSSKLTFLLKDSLVGNSKTRMIACISPSTDNIGESMSTLRFASSVKKIQTHVVQNRDVKDTLIDQLRAEIRELKGRRDSHASLATTTSHDDDDLLTERRIQVHELEQMIKYQERTYMSMREQAKHDEVERDKGISFTSVSEACHMEKDTPYLLNMSDDPMVAGYLIFYLSVGVSTTIGRSQDNMIPLEGLGIVDHLCSITNNANVDVVIKKLSNDGRVCVNGKLIQPGATKALHNGDKIYIGRAFAFRLSLPREAHGAGHTATDHALSLDGLDDEWAALEDCPSWIGLKRYFDQVVNQMTPEQTHKVLEEVKRGCKLCDEANDITAECRSDDNLEFQVDCTSALPASVVIRVVHKLPDESEESPTIYLWSVVQMAERVERMRDYLQAKKSYGAEHLRIDSLLDPWHEPHPGAIANRLIELETLLDAEKQNGKELRKAKQRALTKTMFLWMGDLQFVFQSWASFVKAIHASRTNTGSKDRSSLLVTGLRRKSEKTSSGMTFTNVNSMKTGSPNTGTAKAKASPSSRNATPLTTPRGAAASMRTESRKQAAKSDRERVARSPPPSGLLAVPKSSLKSRSLGKTATVAGSDRLAAAAVEDDSGDGMGSLSINGETAESPAAEANVSSLPKKQPARRDRSLDASSVTTSMPVDASSIKANVDPDISLGSAEDTSNTSSAAVKASSSHAAPSSDSESLRRQLAQAWQLVHALNGQMQQQEQIHSSIGACEELDGLATPARQPQQLPLQGRANSSPRISSPLPSRIVQGVVQPSMWSPASRSFSSGIPSGATNNPSAVSNLLLYGGGGVQQTSGRYSPSMSATIVSSLPGREQHRSASPINPRSAYVTEDPLAIYQPRHAASAFGMSGSTSFQVAGGSQSGQLHTVQRLHSAGSWGSSRAYALPQPCNTLPAPPSPPRQAPLVQVQTMPFPPPVQRFASAPQPPTATDELFNILDKDGNGVITRDEFAGLQAALSSHQMQAHTVLSAPPAFSMPGPPLSALTRVDRYSSQPLAISPRALAPMTSSTPRRTRDMSPPPATNVRYAGTSQPSQPLTRASAVVSLPLSATIDGSGGVVAGCHVITSARGRSPSPLRAEAVTPTPVASIMPSPPSSRGQDWSTAPRSNARGQLSFLEDQVQALAEQLQKQPPQHLIKTPEL